uniref:Sema domain-containing protein n=1 Tax=Romanomermis culicivorax TaxID=13658 RepID=A0A915KK11_ROMCU
MEDLSLKMLLCCIQRHLSKGYQIDERQVRRDANLEHTMNANMGVTKMSFIILNSSFFLLFCEFLLSSNGHFGGNINLQPKQLINAENMGQTFRGNRSSNNFKLLITDGDYLLVGARNAVYNLSMKSLTIEKILEWSSTPMDVDMCSKKSKSEEDCNNYIRVLVKQNDGKILVCGTNAFSPLCRQYAINEDSTYQVKREFSGNAISPYDPNHNSTWVYVFETDELYTGSVSDFTGTDSLIYRKPLDGQGTTTNEMRTLRNDLKCLNGQLSIDT